MNTDRIITGPETINLPRRRFVKGIAMGGVLLGLGVSPGKLLASAAPASAQPTLRGRHFKLTIGPQPVNFTGRKRIATAINGSVRFYVGKRVTELSLT